MSSRPGSTLATVLAALVGACTPCPDALYELTAAGPEVRLPQDEAPHCFGGVEWWYYSGRLATAADEAFGVEAVVFHLPRAPHGLLVDVWVAQYALTDVPSGQFRYAQARRAAPPAAARDEGGFDLRTPLVRMQGGNGSDHIEAAFPDGSFALQLDLTDTRGPVLHDGDGYVPYGAHGRSFYYSRPHMDVRGTLDVGEATLDVSGSMWFDRQWGADLDNPLQRWRWFSIRLDDGTDIMLYQFPARGTPVAFGTVVPPAGPAYPLADVEFVVAPTATWTSDATRRQYEVSWVVELPGEDLVLSVGAIVDDSEVDARATTLNVYWEGLCTVTGWRGDQPVSGYAYVEQVNGGL